MESTHKAFESIVLPHVLRVLRDACVLDMYDKIKYMKYTSIFILNKYEHMSIHDLFYKDKKYGKIKRTDIIVSPRHFFWYIVRYMGGIYPNLMKSISGYDHTSILHGTKKVENCLTYCIRPVSQNVVSFPDLMFDFVRSEEFLYLPNTKSNIKRIPGKTYDLCFPEKKHIERINKFGPQWATGYLDPYLFCGLDEYTMNSFIVKHNI